VTPRVGKPVEVQALWLNALRVGAAFAGEWEGVFEQGLLAFQRRFPNEAGYLNDVVDVDHRPGDVDARFRPNQVFAVGGLPFPLLAGDEARRLVDALEARLLTPLGLRSLAPGEPGYAPRYEGDVEARDGAYHQGTVWPWLIGPFVEAWVRVRGDTPRARRAARERFLPPLLQHLHEAGLGHVSEIADAEPPHTPRGCPFQAWSLGELLRLERVVLREPAETPARSGQDPGAPGARRKRVKDT
jgi:glycogen debranching enzyme